VAGTLKDQVGSIAGGTSVRLRKTLVAAQVALSLLLLIGAGLFIRTLRNLRSLHPGFQINNLIQFPINPTANGYKEERSLAFYRQLREETNALPGVESAALAVMPVLAGNEWDQSVSIEGYVHKPTEAPDPHMQFVSPDYFKTLGIPILEGRDFRPTDVRDAPKVCIVNERFARQFFKDSAALGRHIGIGGNPGTKLDIEIVGIARDTKYESMRDEVPFEVYEPYMQTNFVIGMTAYVRTSRQPEQAFVSLRQLVNKLDANLPVSAMKTLEKQQEESLSTERLVATLSAAFGILATLLSAIGLYGVMAYTVAQRTREIGVRIALGAETSDVLWMVMKEVAMLAAIGIAIGLAASYGVTRFAQSQLYGIQANDTFTVTLATLGIVSVAIAAGFIPARRAARVDPTLALRWE
jgi:predicted permease